jgi:hypothetical protein
VERGDPRLRRLGKGMWKAGTFKAVDPPMSVKDRWDGPRGQVLNVPIACRCCGPDKPSSQSSAEGGFTPRYFNGWLGRETGYEPVDRSA